ncbi:MAG: glycosyltransferase family 2 protein [Nitrospinae bacterium]|nr:glycosyltransferase family 2 protein [Nitrospinota bacterium]
MMPEAKRDVVPRVSVLMTSYNAGQFIRAAVDSVIAQTFTDWELIAVDDGSTDDSLSVLKGYSDSRVRVFQMEKNVGRIRALRFAFGQARGEYGAIMDADDISYPDRLMRQVDFLDKNPDVGLVGSWAKYIDEHANVSGEFTPSPNEQELYDSLGWTNPIPHSSTMYRRQLAVEVGAYSENIEVSNDYALILAVVQRARIAVMDDFLCQVRVLSTSMSRSSGYRAHFINERLLLFRRASASLKLSAGSRMLNRRAIAIDEIKLGIIAIRNKSFFEGSKMILSGIFFAPSVIWRNGPVMRLFGVKPGF